MFKALSDQSIMGLWDVWIPEDSLRELERDAIVKSVRLCTVDPDVLCTTGGAGEDTLRQCDTKYRLISEDVLFVAYGDETRHRPINDCAARREVGPGYSCL